MIQFGYFHFGLPYGSWSPLRRIGDGTRLASAPEGSGAVADEEAGNLLASRVAVLCQLLADAGSWYSIENPRGSYVWNYKPIFELAEGGYRIEIDQCEWGLAPPPCTSEAQAGQLIKKPTTLLTNLDSLKNLSRSCGGDHLHLSCKGKIKTRAGWQDVSMLASRYPEELCRAWAQLVADSVGSRPGTGSPLQH